MKIIRRDYGQGSDTQEQKKKTDELLLDRLIYRKIGSLTDNKSIVTPPEKDGDFHRWLLDMNNLHNHKYYPNLTADEPIPTPDIEALDEYLGTLGQTELYPFDEDTYKVEPWVDIEDQVAYRVLVDETDNTYLTDSAGVEVLVYYNT